MPSAVPSVQNSGFAGPENQIVREIVQSIVDEVDPEQVILFGSRAREDEREDSDIDLVVVESAPFGPARSRRMEAARLYEAVARRRVSPGLTSRPSLSRPRIVR